MQSISNRIAHYVKLGTPQFQRLTDLPHRVETRKAGEDIVRKGDVVDFVFVIESGWALRYELLDGGRRQIMNFMLPGDCFDMMSLTKTKSDHSVSAATDVTLRRIRSDDFLKLIGSDPLIATSFWWVAIQEEAILREQIVRNGRMSARERITNMLLELNRRMTIATGFETDVLDMPVPRTTLADALGLSVVHVSRTLSRLKRDGLIDIVPGQIRILQRETMAEIAEFDSHYLHMEKLTIQAG